MGFWSGLGLGLPRDVLHLVRHRDEASDDIAQPCAHRVAAVTHAARSEGGVAWPGIGLRLRLGLGLGFWG